MLGRIQRDDVFVVQELFVERVGIDSVGDRLARKMNLESGFLQSLVGVRNFGVEDSIDAVVGIEARAVRSQRDERLTGSCEFIVFPCQIGDASRLLGVA
jgi:hypothetical protein